MQGKCTKLDFSDQSIYAGIDVHKKNWKVTILVGDYEHKTFSQDPKAAVLAKYLHNNFPNANYKVVYEAGFCGFQAYREFKQLGVDCLVVHPADVPTSDKERQQKCDKVDSRKLASSLRSNSIESIYVPTEQEQAHRTLLRTRSTFVKDLARTKTRIKSLLMYYGISIPEHFDDRESRSWTKRFIDWLENLQTQDEHLRYSLTMYVQTGKYLRAQILEITRQIRKLAQSDKYKRQIKLLTGIPGIGLLTAMILLTEIGDMKRFVNLDQLCSYVGLIPSMHSTGDKQKFGKLINRGKKPLKIALIESSWVAVRQDPALTLKFGQLCKTMEKNKAIIRIARKLLSRIRHVLINDVEYVTGVV